MFVPEPFSLSVLLGWAEEERMGRDVGRDGRVWGVVGVGGHRMGRVGRERGGRRGSQEGMGGSGDGWA